LSFIAARASRFHLGETMDSGPNARDAAELVEAARARRLFFMEAM